jgi:hypothetical protein
MKQITAVNWLINKLITENEVTLKGENYKLFELAKQMEKEQIIDAHLTGLIYPLEMEATKQAKQYYNETYKSQ